MTTAAELRAAAERIIADWDDPDAVRPAIAQADPFEVSAARHILATVHADDDDPVTREWLHTLGGVDAPSQRGPNHSDEVLFGRLYLWDFNGECWLMRGEDSFELKTRRQIRNLFAALEITPPRA